MSNSQVEYIGRFAPSPTGLLHFGSLIAALASYLDAKANKGLWLVRMEDLDPAREPAGIATKILDSLQRLGLNWDQSVLYQSQRLGSYSKALDKLSNLEQLYPCDCTRPQIRDMGGIYNGSCRNRQHPPTGAHAMRIKVSNESLKFQDKIQGEIQRNLMRDTGDFILLRKDKLFAYQLAVVIDDNFQNITHIVRGHDLLESTPRQIYLQSKLGFNHPSYAHIPIATDAQGDKLSKQRQAETIDLKNSKTEVFNALQFLGQAPPSALVKDSVIRQISWGVENWNIQAVPKLAKLIH